ncbi:MAG: hypothetical protein AABX45_00550 [Nanoarchaeota archaeon]
MNIDQFLGYLKGRQVTIQKDGASNTFKGTGNYSFIQYGQFCQTEQKILLLLESPDPRYLVHFKKAQINLRSINGIESMVYKNANLEGSTIPLDEYNPK